MIKQIKTVTPSINPNSPSPMASMVKLQGGRLYAYGGTFCVSAPVDTEAEGVFKPSAMKMFFRKERLGVSYTVKDNKMVLKQGKEVSKINILPVEQMPVIDTFGEDYVTDFLPVKVLKVMSRAIDQECPVVAAQGAFLKGGKLFATNGRVMVAHKVDVPRSWECNIPLDTIKYLGTRSQKILSVCLDQNHLSFLLEDDIKVCTNLLDCEGYPCLDKIFKQKTYPIDLPKDVMKDLKSLECETVTLTETYVEYSDSETKGRISTVTESEPFSVGLFKSTLDVLLSFGDELELSESEDVNIVMVKTKDVRVIGSVSKV